MCDYFHKLGANPSHSARASELMATDTTLRPGELKNLLLDEIQTADLGADDVSEVGTVLEVRDGVARIYGLNSAVASEMLEFTARETGETVAGTVRHLDGD